MDRRRCSQDSGFFDTSEENILRSHLNLHLNDGFGRAEKFEVHPRLVGLFELVFG